MSIDLLLAADTTFVSCQNDIVRSGTLAKIGANAFVVLTVIKSYADFGTGKAYPGMRKIAQLTGFSPATVLRAIQVLIEHKLLKVIHKHSGTRGQTYIACEQLSIKNEEKLVSTIVLDYVPQKLRERVQKIKSALQSPDENIRKIFMEVEIIPTLEFIFDEKTKKFRKKIEIPKDKEGENKEQKPKKLVRAAKSKTPFRASLEEVYKKAAE